MTSKNLQELMKNLQVFYKCPSCSSRYRLNDIKFLGKVDSHCFMQLSCNSCSLPVLATVFLSEDLSPTGELKATVVERKPRTDLRAKEKATLMAKEPISSAEIADFHLFLSSYQGSLSKVRPSSRKRTK